MRKMFVKTENYRKFVSAVKAVEQRGAAEAGMMLVYGVPGLGKSHIVSSWAAETGAIFLRANKDWTPRYALSELAAALEIDGRGNSQKLFARLLKPTAANQWPIVIDEAEFTLANQAASLEKIRDISDRAENTVILIGMGNIQNDIKRYGQISSRIARVVEFLPATLEDVQSACKQLAEVEMSPELMAEIHRLSRGCMREVLNMVPVVERVAKTNRLACVGVDDLAGIPLSHDWQNRTPVTVRQSGGKRKVA